MNVPIFPLKIVAYQGEAEKG